MLPEGLYLLISISLAAGIITLSKKITMQDLYSLENLAHVDIACLDKTGTLTEGKMQVENAVLFPETDKALFQEWIGNSQAHTQGQQRQCSRPCTVIFRYGYLVCQQSRFPFPLNESGVL